MTPEELVEKILATAPSIARDGQTYYVVEQDRLISEAKVFEYARSVLSPPASAAERPKKSSELVAATIDGRAMRWKAPTVLTWGFDEASFNGNTERLGKAQQFCTRATEDWNDAAHEMGIHERIHFAPAVPGAKPVFQFSLHVFADQPGLLALAFFPNADIGERFVYITPAALDAFIGYDQVGIIRHELGHVLGFRHEHIRPEAQAGMSAAEKAAAEQWVDGTIGGEALTAFDGQSVMHYPIDLKKGLGTLDFKLSDKDKAGFKELYSKRYDAATIREFTA